MKRVLLHSAFWLVYLLQDTVLEMVWVGPALQHIPENVQFVMAFKAAIAAWVPKLIFTYFILFVAIPEMMKGSKKLHWIVLQVLGAIVLTILLYRLIFVYCINPVIYAGMLKERPLFHLLSILLAVMDIGFLSGVAITLKLLRIQLVAREREKNLVKEKLEAELKFLRHQTNPHFLFNTLNNIYALARKRPEHTAEVVMRLPKLLRFILYESVITPIYNFNPQPITARMTTIQTISQQPDTSRSLLKTIAWVGLLAGSLDILSAFVQAYLARKTSPVVVLQFVASGAVGKAAFTGGWLMPLLGLLFHFIIAYSFTAFFFLIYPYLKFLWKNIIVSAVVYGIFIYVVMDLLVLRFTKIPPIAFHWDKALIATAILMVAIGLPVSFFARKFYQDRKNSNEVF